MGTGEVDGLVEADECYLCYSYKGNHSKSKQFKMPLKTFHSNFKGFLQKFRGVSTKHLHSYLMWFKWIELFKDEKELLKIQKVYVQSQVSYSAISNESIKFRKPKFV